MAIAERIRRWRTDATAGEFADADFYFADLISRLDPGAQEPVLMAALLVSAAGAKGDVCIDLGAISDAPLYADPQAPRTPVLSEWRSALVASPMTGAPGSSAPLIIDSADRLYLHRYWHYEQAVARALLERASHSASVPDTEQLSLLMDGFPSANEGDVDWQRLALGIAVLKKLCVISGGPGTGKTSTVVRLIALLDALAHAQGQAKPRIALAAPTGKAAHRLQDSIRAQLAEDQEAPVAQTLHRLLGVRAGSVFFRHDREHPLPVDVLIVDEASMVDLAMMAKLLDALPASARLILLGDRDQLASVQAGAVLGDICEHAAGFSAAFQQALAGIGIACPEAANSDGNALSDCIVSYEKSWRFSADSGIGALSKAVQAQDENAVMSQLEAHNSEVDWLPTERVSTTALIELVIDKYGSFFLARDEALGAHEALNAFERFRVLCPHRAGVFGVEWFCESLEQALASTGKINRSSQWYPGRPVMITRNNHELGLFNGDIGVCLPDPDAEGELRVYFRTQTGAVRGFVPERLPDCEAAWAITVHKSQGSEYDEVLVVLPSVSSELLSRELIYTAITRARDKVMISGSASVLKASVGARIRRASGLSDALIARPDKAGESDA